MVQSSHLPGTPSGQIRLYALLDPEGGRRYIGLSADPEQRARAHWYRRHDLAVRRKNPGLCAWLDTLAGPPAVRDLGPVPYAARHLIEGAAILAHRQTGCVLLNVRIGMRQPFETRVRISAGMLRYRARQRSLTSA